MGFNHGATKRSKSLYLLFSAAIWCLFFGSALFCTQGIGHAAQATAKWNPEGSATGFKLYYGQQNGTYSSVADAGNNTSYTVTNLAAGTTYYFALTAYDSTGVQSGYTNAVSYTTPCTYSISPASSSFSAQGGAGTVGVTTQTGCAWSVTNSTSWITITSGGSGTGSGSVAYSAAANTGTASRTAAMTIAGQAFSCTESGASATTYTITASAGTGGSISPAGATVAAGASQSFTITPNSGYKISDVTVDGASVGTVASYTFTSVAANHTIAATFATSATSGTSLSSLSLNPSSLVGGKSSTGTVALTSAAPSGGISVSLSSNVWIATVPVKVTVPAGATSATFQISTKSPYYATSVTITATYNGVSKSKTLYVTK